MINVDRFKAPLFLYYGFYGPSFSTCKEVVATNRQNHISVFWDKKVDLKPIFDDLYQKTGVKVEVAGPQLINIKEKCTTKFYTMQIENPEAYEYVLTSNEPVLPGTPFWGAVATVANIGLYNNKELSIKAWNKCSGFIKRLQRAYPQIPVVPALLQYLSQKRFNKKAAYWTGWFSHYVKGLDQENKTIDKPSNVGIRVIYD